MYIIMHVYVHTYIHAYIHAYAYLLRHLCDADWDTTAGDQLLLLLMMADLARL